ncbi:hypothetical protein Ciccas_011239 [Cichlidogyrus casuarinus]|uniref:Uncharacterized protein n=1 Tax=Cichlidogyrus casuarinus TaxID=1844966 RepID=A0ABD2PRV0_9PLAT
MTWKVAAKFAALQQKQGQKLTTDSQIPLEEMGMKSDSLVSSPQSAHETMDEVTDNLQAGVRRKSPVYDMNENNQSGDESSAKRRRKSLLPKKHLVVATEPSEIINSVDPYDTGMISS